VKIVVKPIAIKKKRNSASTWINGSLKFIVL